MKIIFEGNLTLEEFGKLIAETIQDFLEKAEADVDKVKMNNPIVQTAFQIEGMEDAVYMTTEHGEMLQVEAEVQNGEIVKSDDNQFEPTEDKRLWSYERMASNQTEVPETEITSQYNQSQIDFKEEFIINGSLKQKLYSIVGTDDELIRYFNIEKNILVAEEVVTTKEGIH
jgi:hypothetical protein